MYNSKIFDSYRFWVVGSLENRKLEVLLWVAPFLAVGLVLALASAPHRSAAAKQGTFPLLVVVCTLAALLG